MDQLLHGLDDGMLELRDGLGLERERGRDEQLVHLHAERARYLGKGLVARPQAEALHGIYRLVGNPRLLRQLELRPALLLPVLLAVLALADNPRKTITEELDLDFPGTIA